MASVIITPAVGAALDVDTVRQQCRIDDDAEDGYITNVIIPAVCALFESETRCRLLTTVMEDSMPAWPRSGRIDLAWGPVQQVTSISYLDAVGQLQLLDPALYQVDAAPLPGEIHRAASGAMPAMQCHPAAVRVRYLAGLSADAAGLPPNARLWLLLHVAHFWNNREAASASELKPLPFSSGLISEWRRIPL